MQGGKRLVKLKQWAALRIGIPKPMNLGREEGHDDQGAVAASGRDLYTHDRAMFHGQCPALRMKSIIYFRSNRV
jgi:hypothetical protein